MKRLFLLVFLCCSCAYNNLEDVISDADSLMEMIALELSHIKNKEDLNKSILTLSKKFFKLSELIILADQFQGMEMGKVEAFSDGKGSKFLFKEMMRLYQIHGARELVEKAQMKGLKKLEKYEETKESLR